jgi:hypothetical protein
MPSPRIAICFFGITRSLSHTLPSIEANVIAPARAAGEVRIFCHFFRQDRIENPRTRESMEIDPEEYRLLQADEVKLEPPETCLDTWDFARIVACGDTWGDGHKSVRNLVHQLHSLHRVTGMASTWNPSLWIFVRPDMRYVDSLGPIISKALSGPNETVWLPLWQTREGHNDRFAVIRGDRVGHKYGTRAERIHDFCASTGDPLHSERLLGFALRGEQVRRIASRATRVRANGVASWESFSFDPLERIGTALEESKVPHLVKRVGHRALSELQRVAELPFPR